MGHIRRTKVTLQPTGSDGSAVATKQISLGRPGILRFVSIDYQNQPATTDIVIKRDTTAGAAILTVTSANTDLDHVAVGTAGMDEGQAASAATDALSGGIPFTSGFYIDVAQGDGQTTGNEAIVVDLYYEFTKKQVLSLTTDASGDATLLWTRGRPGVIRAIAVDYSASADAGTTMTFNRNALDGTQIWAKGAAETDFGPTAVGAPGIDEGNAALAATDAVAGGLLFDSGVGITIASGGNAKTTGVSLWYE